LRDTQSTPRIIAVAETATLTHLRLCCIAANTHEGFPMFSLLSLYLAARRPVALPVAANVAVQADEPVELRLAA
jgi:hypothetical protein